MGELDLAVAYHKEYMHITETDEPGDMVFMAELLTKSGRIEEAYRCISRLPEGHIERHLNLSWFAHRAGDFRTGVLEFHKGKGNVVWTDDRWIPDCPQWQGGPIEGKTICVIGEAGHGDEIIYARWLRDLKERCAVVHYNTRSSIIDPITRSLGVQQSDPSFRYDAWVNAMALPVLLDAASPGDRPYLTPDPAHVERWRARLAGMDRIMALNWTGQHSHRSNALRSIPIDDLVARVREKGTLVSICKGAASCPEGVIDLSPEIETWDDTLAILHLSAICLTSCTSVAHASAASGRPTMVYTHIPDYHVWCGTPSGSRSEWYPDAWVWRQERFGSWEAPFDASLSKIDEILDQP